MIDDCIGPDGPAEAEAHYAALEEQEHNEFQAAKPALQFLLTRIGSWTDARWDQHLRHEFGDEKADKAIRWIEAMFDVKSYAESRVSDNKGADQEKK